MPAPTLVVLAAGMGSRYGGLKQMDPVGPGGTIMDYSVFDAARAGFGDVVFIIRPDIDGDFRTWVATRCARRLPVAFVHQVLTDLPKGCAVPEGRTKPWGTAHAVRAARQAVKGPFAVINADDFYGRGTFDSLAHFLTQPNGNTAFAMVGFRLVDTLAESGGVSRGVCTVERGRLVAILETHELVADGDLVRGRNAQGVVTLPSSTPVSMNTWAFTPQVFPILERGFTDFMNHEGVTGKGEFGLPAAMQAAIASGEATVDVLPGTERWFGLTHAADRAEVAARLLAATERGNYPRVLWGLA